MFSRPVVSSAIGAPWSRAEGRIPPLMPPGVLPISVSVASETTTADVRSSIIVLR
jgi:hypothetical protein